MKIKHLVIALLFLAPVSSARAQYFLNGVVGMISTANEGGYEAGLTWLNNSPSTIHSLKVAWYLGEHFRLGYTVRYGNNVVHSLAYQQRYRLYLIETGFYLEYFHRNIDNWIFSFPVNLSAGSLYVPETYVPVDQPNTAGYLALEPRVQVNRPVLNWLMCTGAIGYRVMSASSLYGTNSPNLAGPTFSFGLILGNFK